jgi:hypothetical protein
MQHWSLVSVFEEYRRFSHPKSRSMDQQFIELFDTSRVRVDPRYLPSWPEIENDVFLLPIVGSPVSEPASDPEEQSVPNLSLDDKVAQCD